MKVMTPSTADAGGCAGRSSQDSFSLRAALSEAGLFHEFCFEWVMDRVEQPETPR